MIFYLFFPNNILSLISYSSKRHKVYRPTFIHMVCNIQIYKNIQKMDIYTEILKYAILFLLLFLLFIYYFYFDGGIQYYAMIRMEGGGVLPMQKSEGVLSGGFCPRGFCPRGFCPEGVLSYIRNYQLYRKLFMQNNIF